MSNEIAVAKENKVAQFGAEFNIFDGTQFDACYRVAKMMSQSNLVPEYLRGKEGDCMIITQQAARWRMDPFAVAMCTSIVKGKLCYEGKLVTAVIAALTGIKLEFEWSGEGDNRACRVHATSGSKLMEITVKLKDVRTDNIQWKVNIDSMLAYRGARNWARVHEPAAMLGIYTKEEVEEGLVDVTPPNQSLKEAVVKNGAQTNLRRTPKAKEVDHLEAMLNSAQDNPTIDLTTGEIREPSMFDNLPAGGGVSKAAK